MIGLLGILVALAGLMYFAYRGVNVLFLAPMMALVACLFHPDVPLFASYTQVFMPALGKYLLQYFPIFILGSIFGKLMADSGAAASLAHFIARKMGSHHAILAVVLACALLTYGGVSLFVVAFTIFPIALHLFREANIPKRLIPGAVALGSFTFTMSALPGTPSIQNAIPMPFFETTAFAAPGLGLIAGLVMFGFGMFWLKRQERRAKAQGESFNDETSSHANASGPGPSMPVSLALVPLLIVVALNYSLSHNIFPLMNTTYLSLPQYGETDLQKVIGIWSLIGALTAAIALGFMLFRKQLAKPVETLNEGSYGSMLPVFNTASEVAFGALIATLGSFHLIKQALTNLFPEQPLISLSVAVNLLAGITGSASGGLSIALAALGDTFKAAGLAANISPEVMHRVASVACSGLDTLPHNGAVITLLAICGLTHKQSYIDIFMTAVVGTGLANIVIVILGSMF